MTHRHGKNSIVEGAVLGDLINRCYEAFYEGRYKKLEKLMEQLRYADKETYASLRIEFEDLIDAQAD